MARTKAGGTAGLALLVSASVFLASCASTGGPETAVDCNSRPQKTVKLKIRLKASGAPDKVAKVDGNIESDGDVIRTCPGDYVSWVVKDSRFSLAFTGPAPFAWPGGRQDCVGVGKQTCEILGVVIADAPRETGLKYTVTTAVAPPLDPIIIVER